MFNFFKIKKKKEKIFNDMEDMGLFKQSIVVVLLMLA